MFREKILTLIVGRIVQLDAEVRIEDMSPDEEEVFTFEVELDEKSRAQAQNRAQQREMEDKLDSIMDMVFAHINQRFQVQQQHRRLLEAGYALAYFCACVLCRLGMG